MIEVILSQFDIGQLRNQGPEKVGSDLTNFVSSGCKKMDTLTFVIILFLLLLAWYYSEYRFRFQSISKFPGPAR